MVHSEAGAGVVVHVLSAGHHQFAYVSSLGCRPKHTAAAPALLPGLASSLAPEAATAQQLAAVAALLDVELGGPLTLSKTADAAFVDLVGRAINELTSPDTVGGMWFEFESRYFSSRPGLP